MHDGLPVLVDVEREIADALVKERQRIIKRPSGVFLVNLVHVFVRERKVVARRKLAVRLRTA